MPATTGRSTKRRKILIGVAALIAVAAAAVVAHELLEDDPPAIPHAVEGRDDCRACHAVPGAARPMPGDHEGRASSSCRGAHRVARPSGR